MSFNNPLNFSISKSTPTTSTTNTTSNIAEKEHTLVPDAITASNSAFLQNILSINSSTLDKSSPTKSLNLLSRTSVAPQVTKTDEPPQISTDNERKPDLLDLFDRFDINNTETEVKSVSVVSNEKASIDEQDEKINYDEVLEESNNSSEMIEIRNPRIMDTEPDQIDSEETNEALNLEDNHPIEDPSDDLNQGIGHVDLNQNEVETDHEELNDNELETVELTKNSEEQYQVRIDEPGADSEFSGIITNQQQTHETNKSPNFEATNEDLIEFDEPMTVAESDSAKDMPFISKVDSVQKSEIYSSNDTKVEANDSSTRHNILEEKPDVSAKESIRERKFHSNLTYELQTNEEPSDQHQQSHKPFDFQTFLTQLRKKSADPIVRYIRSFLVSLTRQGHTFSAEQRIKIILEFKTFMNEKFAIFEPFASMDDTDLENSREGLEKLMMNRLYDQCFPPEVAKQEVGQIPESFIKDLKNDEIFSDQHEKYSWVNASHLDIDLVTLSKERRGDTNFIEFAIIELNKINDYRAPRDKIICILNACKIIFGFLKISNQETNADSFIPLLIMIIIKAKTDHMISNLHYIENYRGEEWLTKGETSYYLSSVQAAVSFILNLSKSDLTIEDKEYDAHMEAWEAEKIQKIASIQKAKLLQPQPRNINNPTPRLQHPDNLSPSSVLLTSAEMFTKSISNFLSPSPQQEGSEIAHNTPPDIPAQEVAPQLTSVPPSGPPPVDNSELIKQTYENLKEIFSELDKAIMKDIIFMNNGDFEKSLDQCLELVNEV